MHAWRIKCKRIISCRVMIRSTRFVIDIDGTCEASRRVVIAASLSPASRVSRGAQVSNSVRRTAKVHADRSTRSPIVQPSLRRHVQIARFSVTSLAADPRMGCFLIASSARFSRQTSFTSTFRSPFSFANKSVIVYNQQTKSTISYLIIFFKLFFRL